MGSTTEAPRLGVVTEASGGQMERGERVRQRRLAMGMGKAPLAELAHIDRATLDRVEAGAANVRETTYVAVERALSAREEEMGMADPEASPGVVRFVVKGVYGAESLVVEGPVENIAELERSVDRIMRRLARDASEDGD